MSTVLPVAQRDDQSDTSSEAPFTPQWGPAAPKGARAVIGRIIREGASVPLFLGQTLVNALRDLGYNTTTSAVCEHVDNSIQWGAREVRVYFHETGPKKKKKIDVLILDNGAGMSPNVLKAATAFGGSMCFDNRGGIGRYGIGMKAAALSMSPVFEIYSWQEAEAFYRIVLDINELSADRGNVLTVPEPQLVDSMPPAIQEILSKPMGYPKDIEDSQQLLARSEEELNARLGSSGTLVYLAECDRLTHQSARTLVEHATKDMAHIYRRQLAAGLKLYINNRRVEPFDPMYWQEESRHSRVDGIVEKQSRLVRRWELEIPIRYDDFSNVRPISVKLYLLPFAEWDQLSKKVLKSDLRVFDTGGISFMRSDREVHIGNMPLIVGKFRTLDAWWRLEVEFPADLDESFGVAVNKQGVRPKDFVTEIIRKAVHEDILQVRRTLARHQSQRAAQASGSQVSESERRATEAEALQTTLLPQPKPQTEAERKALEEGLRILATSCKRANESDEDAYARINQSTYITIHRHEEDLPFFRVDHKLGKVILTVNTAHPFYEKLYKPLIELTKQTTEPGAADDEDPDQISRASPSEALVSLQMLFFSLGRTQSTLLAKDTSGNLRNTFDQIRRQWSIDLATQLTVK